MPYQDGHGNWIYRPGEAIPDWVAKKNRSGKYNPDRVIQAGELYSHGPAARVFDRTFSSFVQTNSDSRWVKSALQNPRLSFAGRSRLTSRLLYLQNKANRLDRALQQRQQFRSSARFGGQFSAPPP